MPFDQYRIISYILSGGTASHCANTQERVTMTILFYSYPDREMLIQAIISIACIFGMFAIRQANSYR